MKKKDQIHNIDELKEKTINQILVVFTIISFIAEFFVAFRVAKYGVDVFVIINFSKTIALWILTIFRKKVTLKNKILLLSLIIFIAIGTGLKNLGLVAPAKLFIVMVPIFLSFILSFRQSIITFFIFLGIFLVFGWLYSSGTLPFSIDATAYSKSPLSWIIEAVVIIVVAIGLLYIGNNYRNSLIKFNKKIQDQNVDLVDKEEKYRKLFEEASDAIMMLHTSGTYFDCNQKACDYFKLSKEEITNKKPSEVSPEYQPDNKKSSEKAKQLLDLALDNKPQYFEWEHIDSEGKAFIVSISLNKIVLSGDKYIQAILRDITEQKRNERELEEYRKELEKKVEKRTNQLSQKNNELTTALTNLKKTQNHLIQTEKMASIGTLTAGVAHEINNPLNYIMGAYVGLDKYFKETGSKNEQLTDLYLRSIKEGVDRSSNIVKGLNQFSRNNENHNEDCDIHSIINNCLVILHNQLKHRVEVITKYDAKSSVIKGNSGELHQVFTNILTNANHAIKDKGMIQIETKLNNENIVIMISDNGCGIEDGNLKQVTDPFFTTKPPGEGTGLGLSISYSLIKKHNGTIEFESEINKGTVVKLSLPIKNKTNE